MPEDAKQWLNEMSKRLEPHIPDPKERVDLLKTIHHVALRAGLDPQLVLALIDVLSKFQKYAVSNAGTATLGSESREQYITCQKSIERDSGSPVDTSMYEKEEFRIISAVLYSSSDPINAPWPAESAFSIFLNPHARNPILGNLSSRLEAWTEVREDFKRTWMKIPPTRGIQAAR